MLLSQYENDTHHDVRDHVNPVELLWPDGILLYLKERLTNYHSLLKRSLRFSYGQHDIEWAPPTALHVTVTNVTHTADIEHSLAMIEAMNRIKYVFGEKYKIKSHPLRLNV